MALTGVNAPVWWSSLVLNSKGNAQAISLNGTIALDQDPAFAMAIRLDKFRNQNNGLCAPPVGPEYPHPKALDRQR
jgi:hypothetical protein